MTDLTAAFLADIVEHPEDDTPRLVYADWLCDHGGPEGEERAEYIRAAIELSRCLSEDVTHKEPALWGRLRELFHSWHATGDLGCGLGRPGCKWMNGFHEKNQYAQVFSVRDELSRGPAKLAFWWSRGFIHEVRMPMLAWRQHGRQLAANNPLVKLVIWDAVQTTDREPGFRNFYCTAPSLFWHFPGLEIANQEGRTNHWYDTAELAHRFIGEGLLRWARVPEEAHT